ncbi:MAG: hypothetical protein IANPNBLG_00894 [Bryobacteraceae bacterium]|nr:hypothetical protein [Bryobacteraceae bacterium]
MRQYHASILIDGTGTQSGVGFVPDPTQAMHYETQVASVLDGIKATITGQVLLREIMRSPMGKVIRIIPIAFGTQDARSVPADTRGASPYNEPLKFPGDLPNTTQRERAGQAVKDANNQPISGTGEGSNVTIRYDALTWMMGPVQTGRIGNLMPDDVLVHELLHALRMMMGLVNTLDMGNEDHTRRFGNTEEFYALIVANIFVSERNAKYKTNQPLRGNIGPVSEFKALTDSESRTFYERHKGLIKKFSNEMLGLVHGGGMKGLIHSPAAFNPLREAQEEFEALQQKYYGGAPGLSF